MLLHERLGAAIDAHDFVVRINLAPVGGYEAAVGRKTSLRVLNSEAMGELLLAACPRLRANDTAFCPNYDIFMNTASASIRAAMASTCWPPPPAPPPPPPAPPRAPWPEFSALSLRISTATLAGINGGAAAGAHAGATFAEAQAACASQGGRLIVPRTAAQNVAVLAQMLTSGHDRVWLGVRWWRGGWRDATATAAQAARAEGVAASDAATAAYDGDDSEVVFSPWAAGQPDRWLTGEECVEMWTTGEWNDRACTDAAPAYACALPVLRVDHPSAKAPARCGVCLDT